MPIPCPPGPDGQYLSVIPLGRVFTILAQIDIWEQYLWNDSKGTFPQKSVGHTCWLILEGERRVGDVDKKCYQFEVGH